MPLYMCVCARARARACRYYCGFYIHVYASLRILNPFPRGYVRHLCGLIYICEAERRIPSRGRVAPLNPTSVSACVSFSLRVTGKTEFLVRLIHGKPWWNRGTRSLSLWEQLIAAGLHVAADNFCVYPQTLLLAQLERILPAIINTCDKPRY